MSIETGNQQKGSYFNLLISSSVHGRKCMVTWDGSYWSLKNAPIHVFHQHENHTHSYIQSTKIKPIDRSLKKFIFRYQDLVEIYSVSAETIINDAFSYSENV